MRHDYNVLVTPELGDGEREILEAHWLANQLNKTLYLKTIRHRMVEEDT